MICVLALTVEFVLTISSWSAFENLWWQSENLRTSVTCRIFQFFFFDLYRYWVIKSARLIKNAWLFTLQVSFWFVFLKVRMGGELAPVTHRSNVECMRPFPDKKEPLYPQHICTFRYLPYKVFEWNIFHPWPLPDNAHRAGERVALMWCYGKPAFQKLRPVLVLHLGPDFGRALAELWSIVLKTSW